MLTPRSLLRRSIGLVVGIPLTLDSLVLRNHTHAEQGRDALNLPSEVSVEAWMTEWMSMSKSLRGVLSVARFRDPIYYLKAPISWTPNPGQEKHTAVTVPIGFVTDFASIPRIFWSLLRPDGEYVYAAVVHDYLYWTQLRSRDDADEIFKLAMEEFDIRSVTVNAIYGAVRVFGQSAWENISVQKAKGEKRVLGRFPDDPRTTWEDWRRRPGVFAS